MAFTIRPLRADEPDLYREIRLEALRRHPDAFGASFEEEAARPLDFFAQRLAGNVIFGGFRGEDLLGTVGFMPEIGTKRAHKAHLWGTYVRAAARGTGLSRLLVEAVLDHARGRVELIQLSVVSGNAAARRLYESLGFTPYGIEERALKVEGQYLNEVHMARQLL